MKVLVIASGADTGGQGYRIKAAFDRCDPDVKVRSVHGRDNYINYPSDIFWGTNYQEIQQLYDEADVVHHKNKLNAYVTFDRGQLKPAIIHHQGTRLRENSLIVRREDRSVGAIPLVSTVDLLTVYPTALWLPAPYNVEEIARYRVNRNRPEVRICHAPTSRKVKGTDIILSSANRVAEFKPVLFDLVENVEWKVVLSRKGRCDIFIDQLYLGYGNNAIEAWCMGLPVIAGVESPRVRELMIEVWGELPFYEANERNLAEKIDDLVRNPELRAEWGAKGLAHVQKFHAEEAVVNFLKPIYERAIDTKSRGAHNAKLVGAY